MDSFISRRHQFCLNFVSKQVARRLWWQISFTVSRDRDQRSEINNVFFWQKLLRCFIYHWVEKLYSILSEHQQYYRLPRYWHLHLDVSLHVSFWTFWPSRNLNSLNPQAFKAFASSSTGSKLTNGLKAVQQWWRWWLWWWVWRMREGCERCGWCGWCLAAESENGGGRWMISVDGEVSALRWWERLVPQGGYHDTRFYHTGKMPRYQVLLHYERMPRYLLHRVEGYFAITLLLPWHLSGKEAITLDHGSITL